MRPQKRAVWGPRTARDLLRRLNEASTNRHQSRSRGPYASHAADVAGYQDAMTTLSAPDLRSAFSWRFADARHGLGGGLARWELRHRACPDFCGSLRE